MLHIQFRLVHANIWPADVSPALEPYVARISRSRKFTAPTNFAEAPLNSAFEFPMLQTLCMKSSIYRNVLGLSLTTPVLRTLDIKRAHLTNWNTLLCTTSEKIRLRDSPVEMLLEILKRCPRALRVFLQTCWPLAPALRELKLQIRGFNIARILEAGFSDVVLHSLTGSNWWICENWSCTIKAGTPVISSAGTTTRASRYRKTYPSATVYTKPCKKYEYAKSIGSNSSRFSTHTLRDSQTESRLPSARTGRQTFQIRPATEATMLKSCGIGRSIVIAPSMDRQDATL
ncbi:hypothetical protein B0H12DRAFT_1071469 [Mycena haematopus]|nr:hypothetical protein B0H12DRAFT_1071469 [Mycena haematopus]